MSTAVLPMSFLLSAVAAAAAFASAPAAAETTHCTAITSLPATLGNQGVYCLTQDLTTTLSSGAAITIGNNNVTLDCNGFKLGGANVGGATQTVGIRATDRKNVTIRGCNVRGFRIGIEVVRGSGHTVEDNRIDLSVDAGIWLEGDSSLVRRNRVGQTGPSQGIYTYGIAAGGTVDVIDNAVTDVTARAAGPSIASGIATWQLNGRVVEGNRVSGLSAASNRYGIQLGFGLQAAARNNTVALGYAGTTATDVGIECFASDGFVARDNTILGFGWPGLTVLRCNESGNVASS